VVATPVRGIREHSRTRCGRSGVELECVLERELRMRIGLGCERLFRLRDLESP